MLISKFMTVQMIVLLLELGLLSRFIFFNPLAAQHYLLYGLSFHSLFDFQADAALIVLTQA